MSGKTYGSGKHPIMDEVRALRKALDLSIEAVAHQVGVTTVALGSWERGNRQPTLGAVDSVLAEFGYELRAVPIGSAIRPPADSTSVLTGAEMVGHLRQVIAQLERLDRQPVNPALLAAVRRDLTEGGEAA